MDVRRARLTAGCSQADPVKVALSVAATRALLAAVASPFWSTKWVAGATVGSGWNRRILLMRSS